MAVETTGLAAVFETAEFQKGLSQYLQGLQKTTTATDATTKATSQATLKWDEAAQRWRNSGGQFATAAQKAAAGVAEAGSSSEGAVGGVNALAVAAGTALVGALTAVVSKVGQAIGSIKEFGIEALHTAGRVDEFTRVALYLGQRTGRTQEEVQGFLDGLEDTGIRADVAANLIANMSRNQLDLAQSTELAAMAQNVAVLAGIDSSDALERLNTIILQGDKLMARNIGLQVDFTAAQDTLASSLGKTNEQLSATELAQANMNAVLEQGAAISGVYGVAQDSPTKALRSLGRQMFNLKAAMGAPFLDAWKSVVDVARGAVEMFSNMVKEGGLLYPVLIQLGAVLSIVADAFKAGAQKIFDFLGGLQIGVRDEFSMMIEQALTYGVEIVSALADGMIKGAAMVLTAAMNAIQGMLTFWFAPGSPPKVAPHIDKWGADTFTEYLKGFDKADFGTLENLQGLLGKFMEGAELQGITLDIGTAISEGPDETFFSKLQAAAGDFGEEVTDLARSYFELADATEKAAKAQDDLTKAQENIKKANTDIAEQTAEYNRLLKAGASPEVLDAQLAQINAAEERKRIAQEQADEAQTALETAQEEQTALEDQVSTQEDIVEQLLKLAEEKEKGAKAGAGAGAGTGAGGTEEVADTIGEAIGGGIGGAITTNISEAIDNAKKMLFEKLGRIFAPLKQRWEESIKPTLQALADHFEEFMENITGVWEEIKSKISPIVENIKTWLETNIPLAIDAVKRAIDLYLMPAFRSVWDFMTLSLIPAFASLVASGIQLVKDATEKMADIWTNTLVPAWENAKTFIEETLKPALENSLKTALETVQPIVEAFSLAFDAVSTAIETAVGWVKDFIEWIASVTIPEWFGGPSGGGGAQEQIRVPASATAQMMQQNSSLTFNMGNNNINTPLQWSAYEARIRRIVREEVRGFA